MRLHLRTIMTCFFISVSFLFSLLNELNATIQVDNIKVDIESTSGLMARNLAIAEARRKAFRQIIETTPSLNYNIDKRGMPSDAALENAMDTFEVEKEKILSKRYIGTLSITFSDVGMDHIFSDNVGPIAPAKKISNKSVKMKVDSPFIRDVLFVPAFITPDESLLWTSNIWRTFWQQNQNNDVFKVLVPLGDIKDIMSTSIEDFMTGDALKVMALLKRYQKDQLIFASLRRLSYEHNEMELRVKIFKESRQIFSSQPIFINGTTTEEAFKAASLEIGRLVQDMDFSKANMQNMALQTIELTATFKGFVQWQKIRNTLKIPEIHKFRISRLSRKSAQINIRTALSTKDLANAFARNGLNFQEGFPGKFSLSINTTELYTPKGFSQ